MRKNKKLICLAVLVAVSALTLSVTSCVSKPPVIEYIHDMPDVPFPVFPPPDPVTFDEETETVSMPLWYWQKIAEYKIGVDAIKEYLDKLREAK